MSSSIALLALVLESEETLKATTESERPSPGGQETNAA
jgi:hypothetical protein